MNNNNNGAYHALNTNNKQSQSSIIIRKIHDIVQQHITESRSIIQSRKMVCFE